jgi:hypothetical protein
MPMIRMRKILFPQVLSLAVAIFFVNFSYAGTLDGMWRYKSSYNYLEKNKPAPSFSVPYIQILGGKLAVSPRCVVKLNRKKFDVSSSLQAFSRREGGSGEVAEELKRQFAFEIANVKTNYAVEKSECALGLRVLLVDGDRMLAVTFDGQFHYFHIEKAVVRTNPFLIQKITPLPFNLSNFVNLCYSMIPRVKGVPQATERCGPLFYPYAASPKDNDRLTVLVGHHHYIRGDPEYHYDFNDPVSNGLFPVFTVLPPLGEVILVRVDDSDENVESRDIFSGTYLSIKDGKVVDQLDQGCSISRDYTCVDRDGRRLFRLTETGKFKKL